MAELNDQIHAQIAALRRTILDDMFKDFNHEPKIWLRKFLEPLVWFSAHRFASLAARFDETTTISGFREALRQFTSHFVIDIDFFGVENVPREGPLLVVSNHPGTIDSVAIGSILPRDDLNIIAQGFPLLQRLPSASRHLIFIDPQSTANISGIRSTIRHLQSGGSVLMFPSGRVEPDPAILPDAEERLKSWSPSLELILRKVPQTQVLVTIVSSVLAPIFLYNPLTRFWKGFRDPLMIAEVTQLIHQLLFRKLVRIRPKISFHMPLSISELQQMNTSIYLSVISEAKHLMRKHLSSIYQMNKKGTQGAFLR